MTVRGSRLLHWRSLGVGAAGVAVAFAVAPSSHADAPGVATTSPATPDTAGNPAATTTTKAAAVTANYGFQKFRVGVQIKSGAYVPDGTTTAGTELTITETGPSTDGHKQVTTCTTDASTAEAGSTATFCLVPDQDSVQAQARVHGTGTPTPPGVPTDELFTAGPGDKITITQTSVNANLLTDPSPQVLTRCKALDPNAPVCLSADGNSTLSTDLIFTDPAPPPVAVDDHYSTVQPNSVDIHVLANDTTHGAPANVTVDSGPSDGTLTVAAAVAGAVKPALATADGHFTYQPNAGFTGTDHFTYTLSTANGTSTAVVTIVVTAPAVTPPASPPPSGPPLANTGTHSGQLIELGGAMLLSGVSVLALARRRRPGQRAD